MCGKGKGGLCPISFGLALGLTCALGMFLFSLWVMYRGMPSMMTNITVVTPVTWTDTGIYVAVGFIKGFIFGLVLALIYDCILCCCRKCRNKGGSCGCCNSNTCNCNCDCCKPNKVETRL